MMADSIIKTIQQHKHDFANTDELRPLLDAVKDKKVVMLGEASHGTHEYYKWRARLSKLLLGEYGFDFVVVEGDWPPCYELNRHVKHYDDAISQTSDVLREFQRWPTWMWANWEVHEFAKWLCEFNKSRDEAQRKGFYGLDVYSLWESMTAIMNYLRDVDHDAYQTAKTAMRCFEPYREDGQRYAIATRLTPAGCSDEVSQLLAEVRRKAPSYNHDREHALSAEQNATVSNNAEHYYRAMASGSESTWNLRDRHMMDTLNRLMQFHGANAKGIVWAHNSHIGDASYTDMASQNLTNLGELGRKEYGRQHIALIGFGSYQGKVLAGSAWGERVEEMDLPPARDDSWEALCHQAGKQFYLHCEDLMPYSALHRPIGHRAVGVVYNPHHERYGNYVPTVLPERYDYFVFFDQSQALHHMGIRADKAKMPDTYPFGL